MQWILELDERWSRRLRVTEQSGALRWVMELLAHSGDSWFWLAGLGVLWWLGDETWRPRAALMAGSILVTALLVFAIKLLVRRRRPEGDWGEIYRRTDPHSFPSGHAARALLLAVLAAGTGPTWWGVLLVVWAPLVVLARVAMGVHYLSDTLAGGLLGILLGAVLLQLAW